MSLISRPVSKMRSNLSRDGYDAYSIQPGSFGGGEPGTDPSITPHRPYVLQRTDRVPSCD
jgi:hypothetical protein